MDLIYIHLYKLPTHLRISMTRQHPASLGFSLLTVDMNVHVNMIDSPGFLQCFFSVTLVGSLPHVVALILTLLNPTDDICASVSTSNTTV